MTTAARSQDRRAWSMRIEAIDARLSTPLDRETLVKLSRERAELEPVYEAIIALRAAAARAGRARGAARRSRDARHGRSTRRRNSTSASRSSTEQVRKLLLPKDAADEKSAILEIRAGTGGSEAALFAGDLFRMYQRYADLHGWKVEVLSESEGEAGGYKEIIAEVARPGRLRPAQVRVGRPPRAARAGRPRRAAASTPRRRRSRCCPRPRTSTSRSGRRTSASTRRAPRAPAASTPTPPIPASASCTSRPGSIVTAVSRSQHQNRVQAMQMLRARLYDLERAEGRRGARRGAEGPGRQRRPLGAHPHLQFPARPGDRPPHQPHPLQARQGARRRRARRGDRGADHRAPGQPARGGDGVAER